MNSPKIPRRKIGAERSISISSRTYVRRIYQENPVILHPHGGSRASLALSRYGGSRHKLHATPREASPHSRDWADRNGLCPQPALRYRRTEVVETAEAFSGEPSIPAFTPFPQPAAGNPFGPLQCPR